MIEVENISGLDDLCKGIGVIHKVAFQSVDLRGHEEILVKRNITECIFLGCIMSESFYNSLQNSGNLIFPVMDVPFKTYPSCLYRSETIYDNFNPQEPETYKLTTDSRIYEHYTLTGKSSTENIYETLARRLHDHGITDALMDTLSRVDPKKIVAVMGGHGLSRGSKDYRAISFLSKKLSENGFFLLSGGGPGAMEATHLGSWFNSLPEKDLEEAIEVLLEAPFYDDKNWLAKAFQVMDIFPRKVDRVGDIGIPTWLYGHEPPTPFASRIAKYFENSVREEGLLALAKGGVIYTPGSAGTIQEIFQDFTQNYYNTYGIVSPMIFYNSRFWNEEKPVYPLLKKLSLEDDCDSLISISDSETEILELLMDFSTG